MSVVTVRGLTKSYGDRQVLSGIDLSVEAGTVFALLGPNGAGKTTFVNILSTLSRPDGGTATVGGHDVVREPRGVHAAISVTGQYAAVDPLLTVRENLHMMTTLEHLPRREREARVEVLLGDFDLVAHRDERAQALSGGLRRRLDIAMSLVSDPAVLFLDEPTTGLDPRSRAGVWELVRDLVGRGTTVVLTTQYLDEADRLADRIAVLDRGRIVAEGTAAELKRRVGSDVVVLHLAGGGERSIPTDGTVGDVRRILTGLDPAEVAGFEIRKPSLDDVFLTLTGRPAEPADDTPGATAGDGGTHEKEVAA